MAAFAPVRSSGDVQIPVGSSRTGRFIVLGRLEKHSDDIISNSLYKFIATS